MFGEQATLPSREEISSRMRGTTSKEVSDALLSKAIDSIAQYANQTKRAMEIVSIFMNAIVCASAGYSHNYLKLRGYLPAWIDEIVDNAAVAAEAKGIITDANKVSWGT